MKGKRGEGREECRKEERGGEIKVSNSVKRKKKSLHDQKSW